jgi:type I restriction enzyme R subunit
MVSNLPHNENSRVKIPALIHLTRLGWNYLSLKNTNRDEEVNIFTDILESSLTKINVDKEIDATIILQEIKLLLNYDDLGESFYKRLLNQSGVKFIDFENFSNNTFNVVTELPYKNGDDYFRPDITLLINGLPLAFIEVKIPDNHEGIDAEFNRIKVRFSNPAFKKFINMTQLLVFSNNMEYDNEDYNSLAGAFYATTSKSENVHFNYFREQEFDELENEAKKIDLGVQNLILSDNNLNAIAGGEEFKTNLDKNSPTNRMLTSLFSFNRIEFLLKYGLVYVRREKDDGSTTLEKHIMRYPQLFASKKILTALDNGVTKGIVWHTQGSGKTALAYFLTKILQDYYSKNGKVAKFYFIVDRLDLLNQANDEFVARGLSVDKINTESRDDFADKFKSNTSIENQSGKSEITVVNIQKFQEDTKILDKLDYETNIQRIYFIDEAHRSYNPKGSFLANLKESDPNSIKISLTGTPLITREGMSERDSKDVFGEYFHTYYYTESIADKHTLRLMREAITTNYRLKLKDALDKIEIEQGDLKKEQVFAHKNYVEPLLDYIIEDLHNTRVRFDDNSIGAIVVAQSSHQAKKLNEIFAEKYEKNYNSALILHDEDSKEFRKEEVVNFKQGKIDILFVYNMLLTGFDSPRLKKLYLGRKIEAHNLLQALTRVNRPYKDFRFGYIVDFADITEEFDATNRAYYSELNDTYGSESKEANTVSPFDGIFVSKEEIESNINTIRNSLFNYDTNNAENFRLAIDRIKNRGELVEIRKALQLSKETYQIIRLTENKELFDRLDFNKLSLLYKEVDNRIKLIDYSTTIDGNSQSTQLLNLELDKIVFNFSLEMSEELRLISNKTKTIFNKVQSSFKDISKLDPEDCKYVSLLEEFKKLLSKSGISESTTTKDMEVVYNEYEGILGKICKYKQENDNLLAKYSNDVKYLRLHKRIFEKISDENLSIQQFALCEQLDRLKGFIDSSVQNNITQINNSGYFKRLIVQQFQNIEYENFEYEVRESAQRIIESYMNYLQKQYQDEIGA